MNFQKTGDKYTPYTKMELYFLIKNEEISLGDIDTGYVMSMAGLFEGSRRKDFSGIETWNVSNVEDMSLMFHDAVFFNHDISLWNTSNVCDMSAMFWKAQKFNQDISLWNTASVENMQFMFSEAESFNQDLCNWNVSKVQYMDNMFF